jgi:hypothetical protein
VIGRSYRLGRARWARLATLIAFNTLGVFPAIPNRIGWIDRVEQQATTAISQMDAALDQL